MAGIVSVQPLLLLLVCETYAANATTVKHQCVRYLLYTCPQELQVISCEPTAGSTIPALCNAVSRCQWCCRQEPAIHPSGETAATEHSPSLVQHSPAATATTAALPTPPALALVGVPLLQRLSIDTVTCSIALRIRCTSEGFRWSELPGELPGAWAMWS